MTNNYSGLQVHRHDDNNIVTGAKKPIKEWTVGVPVADNARQQLFNTANMPFIHKHLAVMPDVHWGMGSTVGSVVPTHKAIIPACVGVDLGCGMVCVKTTLKASHLPDNLSAVRSSIEAAVPHGRTNDGKGESDKGSWMKKIPGIVENSWVDLNVGYQKLLEKNKKLLTKSVPHNQLGSLGGGNHFIELCLDENQDVWIMLHSGSRGVGSRIGMHFIELAKREMERWFVKGTLPDDNLSYLAEGSQHFNEYIEAVDWAQNFARINRELMMVATLAALKKCRGIPKFEATDMAVNCFRGDTTFITSTGVKSLGEVAGSTVNLLTSTGKWVDAPIKSFGDQSLVKLTLSRYDVTKTLYTTSEHRWFVDPLQRSRVTKLTKELEPGDRLAFQRAEKSFDGFDPLFEYRGFVFGDGSKNSVNTSLANFCGPKIPLLDRFKKLGVGNEPRTYGDTVRVTGLKGHWKKTVGDLFNASPNQIAGWLAGYFAADGDIDKTGRPTITSARREHLEVYRDLCWRIGIATYPIRVTYRTGYGDEDTPLYLMGLSRNDLPNDFFLREEHRVRLCNVNERLNWKVLSVEPTDLVEEVFCAEVDGTHSFVLEGGILTSNCHHNYVTKEYHFGKSIWITRKGAIRAGKGELGIIPGSMGAKSFIVRGLGNRESFCSASHGAGRVMSRTEAKKTFSVQDHIDATQAVECRKDADVVDETPKAYKDIDAVMKAQESLVEVVHTLRQVVCVKG